MAESMDLDDAIAAMKESGSVPDGFLFRIIVEEGSDLQPFGTSVYGLTVTHELELNRAKPRGRHGIRYLRRDWFRTDRFHGQPDEEGGHPAIADREAESGRGIHQGRFVGSAFHQPTSRGRGLGISVRHPARQRFRGRRPLLRKIYKGATTVDQLRSATTGRINRFDTHGHQL